MDSVKKYVESHSCESLFENQDFEFDESKDNALIQAADFIAGTWAKILDTQVDSAIRDSWRTTIKNSAIFVDFWPPSANSILGKSDSDSYLNNLVRQQCYWLVQQYLSTNQNTGSLNEEEAIEMEARLAALRFLLYENEVLENDQFVYSQKIIGYLKSLNYGEFTPRKLAGNIISPLRDSGVIISSGNKGYRIPTNVSDIVEFARTTGDKIIPMLSRLGKARDHILLASNKSLNIIDESGYSILNQFVDQLKESPHSTNSQEEKLDWDFSIYPWTSDDRRRFSWIEFLTPTSPAPSSHPRPWLLQPTCSGSVWIADCCIRGSCR